MCKKILYITKVSMVSKLRPRVTQKQRSNMLKLKTPKGTNTRKQNKKHAKKSKKSVQKGGEDDDDRTVSDSLLYDEARQELPPGAIPIDNIIRDATPPLSYKIIKGQEKYYTKREKEAASEVPSDPLEDFVLINEEDLPTKQEEYEERRRVVQNWFKQIPSQFKIKLIENLRKTYTEGERRSASLPPSGGGTRKLSKLGVKKFKTIKNRQRK